MIYQYFHISKQAVSQYEQRNFKRLLYHQDLLSRAHIERTIHPRMGAKVLYDQLHPEGIGRVRYEKLLMENGFRLRRLKNYFKTTDSEWVHYKNLIANTILNDINQVWVSDITYYQLGENVCYITTIMDLYSRRVLGYSVSERMLAEQSSMKSLRMAFKERGIRFYDRLIHHSDRGSQYRYKKYVDLLESKGAMVSMCKNVYDNPHMERLNGTLKNDYLIPMGVDSFKQLKKILPRVIKRYNTQRPHSSLEKLAPLNFEQYVTTVSLANRPKTRIKPELSTIHSN
jgi:transposase InsO family protein